MMGKSFEDFVNMVSTVKFGQKIVIIVLDHRTDTSGYVEVVG
jgi:hypothetical protein